MNKQKRKSSQNKRTITLKSKIEWTILTILIFIIPFSIWSNLFAYEYYYFKCEDRPTEVFGDYYRIPYDEGYGIHPGSDYSNCSYSAPAGKSRDPSTKAGKASAAKNQMLERNYDLYIPDGYEFVKLSTYGQGDSLETSYEITTKSNLKFRVREMNKDSEFSYTNLCTQSAGANWTGTVIGKDNNGRDICRINPNKYIKDYILGINIGRTGIMLQADIGSIEVLDKEAADIFSSMKPYSN